MGAGRTTCYLNTIIIIILFLLTQLMCVECPGLTPVRAGIRSCLASRSEVVCWSFAHTSSMDQGHVTFCWFEIGLVFVESNLEGGWHERYTLDVEFGRSFQLGPNWSDHELFHCCTQIASQGFLQFQFHFRHSQCVLAQRLLWLGCDLWVINNKFNF